MKYFSDFLCYILEEYNRCIILGMIVAQGRQFSGLESWWVTESEFATLKCRRISFVNAQEQKKDDEHVYG